MNEQPKKRTWWFVEIWEEYRELFKSFVADLLIAGMLVGGLQMFHILVAYIKFSEEENSPFLKIHYYGNLTAFLIFIVGFVVDIIVFMYGRARTVWRTQK